MLLNFKLRESRHLTPTDYMVVVMQLTTLVQSNTYPFVMVGLKLVKGMKSMA